MTSDFVSNRARSIVGTTLMLLPGMVVLLSETMKFLRLPAVVQQMATAGFGGGKIFLVAALGSVSAVLFLYSRTRSIGLLFLSSFLGGAICVHVQQGKFASSLVPCALLGFAWLGAWLRHPQMLWSLAYTATRTNRSDQSDLASPEAS